MKFPVFSMVTALVLGFAFPTASQSTGASPSELDTPEPCRGANVGMPNMAHSLSASMANMSDAQKGYLQSLVKMQLTSGVMVKDPDVAFVCLMIRHHQGAIDMAHVVLTYGKDAETRKMAEATIATQEKEIIEMKAWLSQKPASNASAPRSP